MKKVYVITTTTVNSSGTHIENKFFSSRKKVERELHTLVNGCVVVNNNKNRATIITPTGDTFEFEVKEHILM